MERVRHTLNDYNKVDYNRDATKYFIVYEGEKKEPLYFGTFNNQYLDKKSACILHVFENDTNVVGSQPKKLIERAEEFINNPPDYLSVTPSREDKFRFVLDVDDHPIKQFEELNNYCKSLPDANLYISNFCFEIWLWFHLDDIDTIQCSNSAGMKTELGEKHKELKLKNYPKSYLERERIDNAILRAKKLDYSPANYFPAEKTSKVYLLMEELLQYSLENSTVRDAKEL